MSAAPSASAPADAAPEEEGWESRVLCADEACIGLCGADGRCKVCGRARPDFAAVAPVDAGVPPSTEAAPAAVLVEGLLETSAPSTASQPGDDDDFGERRLCPDGCCTGLLGADGRCKVCGRGEAAV